MSPKDNQFRSEIKNALDWINHRQILDLTNFERIIGGIDTEIFAFDVIYDKEQSEAMIIRIFSDNRVNESTIEFVLQKSLYQNSILVPKQLFINKENSVLGRDYIIWKGYMELT